MRTPLAQRTPGYWPMRSTALFEATGSSPCLVSLPLLAVALLSHTLVATRCLERGGYCGHWYFSQFLERPSCSVSRHYSANCSDSHRQRPCPAPSTTRATAVLPLVGSYGVPLRC